MHAYSNAFKDECVFSVFTGGRSFECYVRYYPKTNTNDNNRKQLKHVMSLRSSL